MKKRNLRRTEHGGNPEKPPPGRPILPARFGSILLLLLFSLPPLLTAPAFAERALAPDLRIYEDKTGSLTFPDLLQDPPRATEIRIRKGFNGVSFTRSTIWIRCEVPADPSPPRDRASSAERGRVVDLRFAKLESVDFWRHPRNASGTEWEKVSAGPFRERGLREFAGYQYFAFRIAPDPDGATRFWMRLQSRDQIQFPLFLVTPEEHAKNERNLMLFFGLYFGMMGGLILYNLFLLKSLKDLSSLWFVLFTGCFTFWIASFEGVLAAFLHPVFERWPAFHQHMHLVIALTNVFALGFVSHFLELGKKKPWQHRFFRWYPLALLASVAILAVVDYQGSLLLALGGTSVSVLSVFLSLARSIRGGNASARYMLYGWGCFVTFSMGALVTTFGWLPYNLVTGSLPYVGSVALAVLSSYAIAHRYQIMNEEMKRSQSELARQQREVILTMEERHTTDFLTGLPNRNRMIQDVEGKDRLWLLILNLDGFRAVNGFYGTAAGDHILKEIGRRIARFAEDRGCSAYKFRGDEFGVVAERDSDRRSAETLGNEIHQLVVGAPIEWKEHRIEIDVTVGVGLGKTDLFEKTDLALQSAKQDRRNVAVVSEFQSDLIRYEENLRWVTVIREAIRNDRVLAHFQPILNNRTGRIEKVESLMRLLGEDDGIVPPGIFLPIARKAKLYGELQRRMIDLVGASMPSRDDLEFSLNVAGEDLRDERTVRAIFDAIEGHAHPERFVFELLETERIGGDSQVADFCRRVKARGCKIAVDDFGTGYSNFENLLRLQVDVVKIDGSLVREIDKVDSNRIMVRNIVDFCGKLGMKTVAEYVHSQAVQDAVVEIGVDYSQGWHVGRPATLSTTP